MKKNLPVTQKENNYNEDAVIISITDLKGRITYVNNDFIGISGFKEEELIGQSHNIVRHPDMPPAAFEDLWKTVKSGESWRGIVKNRCKNGDHYWVDAYVTPVYERGEVVGYQSVRSKPSRKQIEQAAALYAKLMNGTRKDLPRQRRILDIPLNLRISFAFLGLVVINVLGGALTLLHPDHAMGITVGSTVLITLAAAVTWWLLARTVVKPMKDVVAAAKNIAGGDLTGRIEASGNDEIGQMQQAIKLMQARLRTIIGRLAENSQNVAAAAEQLAGSAEGTNRYMEQQSQETELVATAMNQMTATVVEVSSNIVATADAAKQADEEAEQGATIVANAVAAIDSLTDGIGESVSAVSALREDGNKISQIMDVILEIAEQTNLLALNAAIEAARAGEVGRGFAVVADEVRTLASRTRTATEEISGLITSLQTRISGTVSAMDAVGERAVRAQSEAKQVGLSLDSITRSVSLITDMSDQIATAATQQNAVAEEINRNIFRIRDLSGETVERAQDSNRAGHYLAELAGSLQKIAASFNVGGGVAEFDFDKAKSAHLDWKRKARAYLDGDSNALSLSQAVSHKSCMLGKWYYGVGLAKYGHLAEMKNIEDPHAKLHSTVREIIDLKRFDKHAEAEAKYREVDALSGQIVRMLDDLSRKAH